MTAGGEADRPNPAGLWHSFEHGIAEFFLLDVRSQRDPAADPDTVAPAASVEPASLDFVRVE